MPITNTAPAPNTTRNTSSATRVTVKVSATLKARTEALVGFGQLGQVPLIATRQYADCGAISLHWPHVAEEIAKLADSQPVIAKFIDPLIQIGPYTGLVTAVLPFILQIGVNHGVFAPGAMGTVPTVTLTAQVESSLAQQELEALYLQRDAEKAAAAIRREINEARAALADNA
jgi:hypothetical protein